jgi:nuclear pore complex protein Nup214
LQDVAFKLQSKVKLFENDLSASKSAALLATASTVGLVFSGLPTPELQVVQLRSLEYSDMEKETVPRRTYPLPSPAFNIGISCDHSLLAVDVVVNGVPFLYIYKVDSFLTNVSVRC